VDLYLVLQANIFGSASYHRCTTACSKQARALSVLFSYHTVSREFMMMLVKSNATYMRVLHMFCVMQLQQLLACSEEEYFAVSCGF